MILEASLSFDVPWRITTEHLGHSLQSRQSSNCHCQGCRDRTHLSDVGSGRLDILHPCWWPWWLIHQRHWHVMGDTGDQGRGRHWCRSLKDPCWGIQSKKNEILILDYLGKNQNRITSHRRMQRKPLHFHFPCWTLWANSLDTEQVSFVTFSRQVLPRVLSTQSIPLMFLTKARLLSIFWYCWECKVLDSFSSGKVVRSLK